MKNTLTISGWYFDGRMLENGFMYLINKFQMDRFRILPWYNIGSGQVNFSWNWIYWYTSWMYRYPSFINVISFDLNRPTSSFNVRSFIGEDSNLLYMSKRNIYLIQTYYEFPDYTRISKIRVNNNFIRPIAFAKIRGTANNQFAFSELNNNLRVATTNLYGDPQTSSNVFILNYYLQTYGRLTNIAPTEKIYSCRFVAKRLYLVTFRQVDPFFVIDLSNPSLPRILGELKIPGFSTYLHPYDENTIIGLGRDTTTNSNGQTVR